MELEDRYHKVRDYSRQVLGQVHRSVLRGRCRHLDNLTVNQAALLMHIYENLQVSLKEIDVSHLRALAALSAANLVTCSCKCILLSHRHEGSRFAVSPGRYYRTTIEGALLARHYRKLEG